MKDGLYVLPSDNGIIAVKVKDGIPADVCAAEGPSSVSLLKLTVTRPDWNFAEAETLGKPVPGAKDRAGFTKFLVKTWLSLPLDELRNQVGMFMNAWIESADVFESVFALTTLISPSSYVSAGHTEYVSEEAKARDKLADLVRSVVFQPSFNSLGSVFRKDPAGVKLKTRWLNGETIDDWEWTKNDAEEAAAIMKANPAINNISRKFPGNAVQ